MTLSPIRELVKRAKQIAPKSLGRNSFTYIDISSVDKDSKRITNPQLLTVDEAPSRARKEIKTNDVLVATVRPNLNGVAIVPQLYDNEIVSTGFCVLRADETKLDPRYLFYFTQTGYFVMNLTKLSIGAGYPAVSDEDILDTEIPLPPLPEQRRIASILAHADHLRRLRRYADALSASLLQSVFLEMFGDPVSNSKGWDLLAFDDVCAIDAEMIDPREEKYLDYLHIGGANIESVSGNLIDLRTSREEGLISGKFLVQPDNILFSKIRPKLRKVAYPKIHAVCSADIYPLRIISEKCNVYYFLHYLRSEHFSKKMSEIAESRTNIPKVNRDELSEQYIPVPPFPEQECFARAVQRAESLRRQQAESACQGEELFQALLAQSFGSA